MGWFRRDRREYSRTVAEAEGTVQWVDSRESRRDRQYSTIYAKTTDGIVLIYNDRGQLVDMR